MEYTKLDSGLANALDANRRDTAHMLEISVRTTSPLSAPDKEELRRLGGQGVDSGLGTYTANANRQNIVELSSKPWVQRLSLARQVKMR